MGLRDIGATLPPGFRFYPSDEELVCHYLYKKVANEEVLKGTLVDIDLHTCEPWQLPEVAKLNSNEWYFFNFRDRKYATGYRTNRATKSGYWKATGKDRAVLDPITRSIVGMRKTLVFYRNRAPNGIKTGWIMHEFRLENPHVPPKEDWVLCRVFQKSKGENSGDKLSPQDFLETAFSAASPPIHDHRQTLLPGGYSNQQAATSSAHSPPSSSHRHSSSLLNPNFLKLSHHHHQEIMKVDLTPNSLQVPTSKCEDNEYGFLFDMSFNEDGIMGSNLEDMRFDII